MTVILYCCLKNVDDLQQTILRKKKVLQQKHILLKLDKRDKATDDNSVEYPLFIIFNHELW